MIDLDKVNRYEDFTVDALVAEVKVCYRHFGPFYVKVWKSKNTVSPYTGECEYSFWGPEQFSPYKSLHSQNTIENAINDALGGIRNFDNLAKYPDEVVFFTKKVGSKTIYFDGTGREVTEAEARQRIDNFKAIGTV